MSERETWKNNPGALEGIGYGKSFISVAMRPEDKRRVQECALALGIPVSQLVRDAIDEALLSHGH